ncbi:hypothetical protein BKA58DRAFT_413819 [Alternaria rosae]|uniref:uncharacterized protein n=1 Tax=Alternaria rosae TaxID=1187941 RepID=UPI001E8D243B|nr:uncharacterized protein BKA58DRAFT_413819 [Alternaria rosae]KAH6865004.1 hypothetical protein BKA58DRAFT_413819 [Alternaria rosae]
MLVAYSAKRLDPEINLGLPSYGGHGTLEVLQVTQLLERAGITCYIVGPSALMYYGAAGRQNDWTVCVPTEKLGEASSLLHPADSYETFPPRPPRPWSLLHTFARFRPVGIAMAITLVPSDDVHIDCIAPNIECSQMGLPYPVLEIFAQSPQHLQYERTPRPYHLKLDAENDVAWARRKHEKKRASVPLSFSSCMMENDTLPEGYFSTRFRGVGSPDLRSEERDCV